MTLMLEHKPLCGARVALEPLTMGALDALFAAAQRVGPEGDLTSVPKNLAMAEVYIQKALSEQAEGRSLPYTTRDLSSGHIVGTTRFMNIEYWNNERVLPDVVEIGATWLAREARRTYVNSEAKLLMLTHAFEVFGVERVTFKTDARNLRSRNAIERIGATYEGTLRRHGPAYDGGVRDAAFFSIIRAEWPDVQAKLRAIVASREH